MNQLISSLSTFAIRRQKKTCITVTHCHNLVGAIGYLSEAAQLPYTCTKYRWYMFVGVTDFQPINLWTQFVLKHSISYHQLICGVSWLRYAHVRSFRHTKRRHSTIIVITNSEKLRWIMWPWSTISSNMQKYLSCLCLNRLKMTTVYVRGRMHRRMSRRLRGYNPQLFKLA